MKDLQEEVYSQEEVTKNTKEREAKEAIIDDKNITREDSKIV